MQICLVMHPQQVEWGSAKVMCTACVVEHRQCSLVVSVGTVGSCAWSEQIWKISKDEQQQQQPGMRYAISLGGPII